MLEILGVIEQDENHVKMCYNANTQMQFEQY